VAGCVMGLYEPLGVMRRRIGALSDEDGETGRVLPPEVGWLPYMAGARGLLRRQAASSAWDMTLSPRMPTYLGWNGNLSESGDGVFSIVDPCMSISLGLAALGSTSPMTWSRGSTE
jgi:hypothetical protein